MAQPCQELQEATAAASVFESTLSTADSLPRDTRGFETGFSELLTKGAETKFLPEGNSSWDTLLKVEGKRK